MHTQQVSTPSLASTEVPMCLNRGSGKYLHFYDSASVLCVNERVITSVRNSSRTAGLTCSLALSNQLDLKLLRIVFASLNADQKHGRYMDWIHKTANLLMLGGFFSSLQPRCDVSHVLWSSVVVLHIARSTSLTAPK